MPNRTPLINLTQEQRRRWLSDLRDILAAERSLVEYLPLLNGAVIFSERQTVHSPRNRQAKNWRDGKRHMIAYRNDAKAKFTVICFRVLDWRHSAFSALFDEAVIQIDLFCQASHLNEAPFVIPVIENQYSGSLRYCHALACSKSNIFDSINISIADLLDRFPGYAETILDQVVFIAEVIFSDPPVEGTVQ